MSFKNIDAKEITIFFAVYIIKLITSIGDISHWKIDGISKILIQRLLDYRMI